MKKIILTVIKIFDQIKIFFMKEFEFYMLNCDIYNRFYLKLTKILTKNRFSGYLCGQLYIRNIYPYFSEKLAFSPKFCSKSGVVITTNNYNNELKEKKEEEERKLQVDRGSLKVINDNKTVEYNYLLEKK